MTQQTNNQAEPSAEQIAQNIIDALKKGARISSSPDYQYGLEFAVSCIETKLSAFASQSKLIEEQKRDIESLSEDVYNLQQGIILARNYGSEKEEMCDKMAELAKSISGYQTNKITAKQLKEIADQLLSQYNKAKEQGT